MTIFNNQIVVGNDQCNCGYTGAVWLLNVGGVGLIGRSDSLDDKNGMGLRFLNVVITQGARICSGQIKFISSAKQVSSPLYAKITGDKEPNAAAFSTIVDYQARRGTVVGGADDTKITTAQVSWDYIDGFKTNDIVLTPAITTIIQEIVNQGTWASGNALVLFVDDHLGQTILDNTYRQTNLTTGTKGPTLIVEWTIPLTAINKRKVKNLGWV